MSICPICQSSFRESKHSISILTSCKHVFHLHCIQHWFEISRTCPLCKGTKTKLLELPLDLFINESSEEWVKEFQELRELKESYHVIVHEIGKKEIEMEELKKQLSTYIRQERISQDYQQIIADRDGQIKELKQQLSMQIHQLHTHQQQSANQVKVLETENNKLNALKSHIRFATEFDEKTWKASWVDVQSNIHTFDECIRLLREYHQQVGATKANELDYLDRISSLRKKKNALTKENNNYIQQVQELETEIQQLKTVQQSNFAFQNLQNVNVNENDKIPIPGGHYPVLQRKQGNPMVPRPSHSTTKPFYPQKSIAKFKKFS